MQAVLPTPRASAQADAEISAAAPPLVAVVAGRVVLVLGVFTVLYAVQSLTNLRFLSWHWLLPALLLPLGVASAVVGWKLSRARGWAAVAGFVLCAVTALLTGAFTLLSLSWGYFSLLSLIVGLAAFVGGLLAALSIGACQRADRARAALAEQGFDLGV
ncbi:MAG: hypothetical protein HS104_32205 [Polyangiaceae bacterium]|nr:hypothetical protein [Polyangiaceae bacterium]MCL4749148.1 hypothetical protein [Myxococcales bacterium]